MPKSVPDRWLDYDPFGDVIKGTKILAFKVPLQAPSTSHLQPAQRFTVTNLLQAFPRLKCVVDLTNTDRYYNPEEFRDAGVRHEKLMTRGHHIPDNSVVNKFFKLMEVFTSSCGKDEIVGVHCTHGINRTGYLICRYLVQQLGWTTEDALAAFHSARGYHIERQTYVADLKSNPQRQKIDTNKVQLTLWQAPPPTPPISTVLQSTMRKRPLEMDPVKKQCAPQLRKHTRWDARGSPTFTPLPITARHHPRHPKALPSVHPQLSEPIPLCSSLPQSAEPVWINDSLVAEYHPVRNGPLRTRTYARNQACGPRMPPSSHGFRSDRGFRNKHHIRRFNHEVEPFSSVATSSSMHGPLTQRVTVKGFYPGRERGQNDYRKQDFTVDTFPHTRRVAEQFETVYEHPQKRQRRQ